ncbi:MAG: DMT family transporter [Candidatus Methanofastidiosa archaeon]|nr:DMT family transporter [Candidatus Methanofastidiosa archaeon]
MKGQYVILFTGVVVAATSSTLIRMSDADPLVIATYRMGFASIVMCTLALKAGLAQKVARYSRRDKELLLLSGFFLALHFASWISSLSYTSVAVSVIIVDSSPFFVLVLSYIFLGEWLSRHGGAGMVMLLIGGILIVQNEISKDVSLIGASLALLGSVTLACYLVIGRRMRRDMDTLSYVSLVYFVSFLFLFSFSLVSGRSFLGYGGREYLIFFLLAIGPSCVGHTLYNYSLRHFKASQVSASILAEPICAIVLAALILEEMPSPIVVLGGFFIIFGLALILGILEKEAAIIKP